MNIDYTKYLEENKSKVFKKLLKLDNITPNDKLEIKNIIPWTDKNKEGSVWEFEIILNDSIHCYWRVSASIFNQICQHNKDNNTDICYLQKDRKVRVGKINMWLLKISTSPIDNPKIGSKIKEVEINDNQKNMDDLVTKASFAIIKNQWDTITESEKILLREIHKWNETLPVRKYNHINHKAIFIRVNK